MLGVSVYRLLLSFSLPSIVFTSVGWSQFEFTEYTSLLGDAVMSGAPMAVVDMNGDGKDDLVRLAGTRSLVISYQEAPGEPFSTYVHGSVPRDSIWAVCAADVNRNGRNDLFLGPSDGGGLLLLSDARGSSYSTVELPGRDTFVQGSLFADLDNDGNIDLFACDDNANNKRYRNNGAGSFSLDSSLIDTDLPAEVASGNYAAIFTDYDNDGHRDLYLSKCRVGVEDPDDGRRINRMFRNNGSNVYADVGPAVGLADGAQTWCADFGDIDNDGDLDCFVLNHGLGATRLYENNGNASFTDITARAGLTGISYFGIQALFRDFDNDTFIDLIVCASDLGRQAATYRLYRNNGDQSFSRIPGVLRHRGGEEVSYLHSCALGDLNHDGFIDIYGGRATSFNEPSDDREDLLFLNDGNANHFLGVQVRGTLSNANGIGTRLELHGAWGIQVREVRAGEGYGIQNSLTKIFGLGPATVIDKLVVKWPSGITEEYISPGVDQFLEVSEGQTWEDDQFTVPVIASPLAVTATLGERFDYRVSTRNLSLHYGISDAPPGMSIDRDNGVITWFPVTEGIETVGIEASSPAGVTRENLVVTVEVTPPLPDLGAAVANGQMVLVTSEDSWVVQKQETRDGQALQSGSIGDQEQSWVEARVTGPGQLAFWWKVSSEEDYDELVFRVDGGREFEISGESGWQQVVYEVPDGSHTLRWSYEKDVSRSVGNDAGYLDEISWAPLDSDRDGLPDDWEMAYFGNLSSDGTQDPDNDGRTNTEELSAGTDPKDGSSLLRILGVNQKADGISELVFQSVPGRRYIVEGSTTLQDFYPVTGEVAADAAFTTVSVMPRSPGRGEEVAYVGSLAPGKVLVPDRDLAGLWRGGAEGAFAATGGDADWQDATQGIGYDVNQELYDQFIGRDLEADMYRRHSTAYLRLPFVVENPLLLTGLVLRVRYDDGFAAWLNGIPVASDNVPEGPLGWESSAPASRPDDWAVNLNPFDLRSHLGALRAGRNILAIQGLNRRSSNLDFLVQAELIGQVSAALSPAAYFFRVRMVE